MWLDLDRKLRIWSHLLKKSLMENFIFLCSEYRAIVSSEKERFKSEKG